MTVFLGLHILKCSYMHFMRVDLPAPGCPLIERMPQFES
jgi:hypothetical protein